MNANAVQEMVDTGLSRFIKGGVCNWEHPDMPSALARLRVAQDLYSLREYNLTPWEVLARFREKLKQTAPEVAKMRANARARRLAETGPRANELRDLRAERKDLINTPHAWMRDDRLAMIDAQITDILTR